MHGFEDDVDTLVLNEDLWGGGLTAQEVLDTYATESANTVTFDFGNGDVLVVNQTGITEAALLNDIEFV